MSWLGNLFAPAPESQARSITTIEDYLEAINDAIQFGGLTYQGIPVTTYGEEAVEENDGQFESMVRAGYAANGIVFAVELARTSVFSATRFAWQRLRDGKPSDMFGDASLRLLERPWPNGTTQDLLIRVLQDADLAGNAYLTTSTPLVRVGGNGGKEIVRLRPDWVNIAMVYRYGPTGRPLGRRLAGYLYREGGAQSDNEPEILDPDRVAHFAPTPDPLANFRGMSWLTPVVREIQADEAMERHKLKFFRNGATPNMIVRHPEKAKMEDVKRFAAWMEENYAGIGNAYKTLNLYPGADATVVGKDFEQVDFRRVQGAGETRIAAAGGVPPIIPGLSEGLAAATYSNYGQARRRFADGTIHPLWANVAGALESLLPDLGDDVRLWYDASDVPFLREDGKDAAEIAETQANTIRQLIDAGYKPDSVILAVQANDWRLLEHSGLYSVQLQKPGAGQEPPALPQGDSDDDNE